MNGEKFIVSSCPNYIEWYKCYNDPARKEWIDGMEFRSNPDWDERQKAKWHFFYRPVPALVGRPQKKEINKTRAAIYSSEKQLELLKKNFGVAVAISGIVFIISLFIWKYLATIPFIYAVVRFLQFKSEKSKIEYDIKTWGKKISALNDEINILLKRIPKFPNASVIEDWLKEELGSMERKCLSEIVNAEIDEASINDLIRHEPISDLVRGLLIQGWGLLQPSKIRGPFGEEKTGADRVRNDIGASIATWRSGTKGQPIYRVFYLQYVFLLEKNINVYSFFYDFITRQQYGKRSETFQYNHVTNFSIREVEIEEEDWVRGLGLSRSLTGNLFGKEINAFSLAVSSSACFRCVLIDNAVVQGMNQWLNLDEKFNEIDCEVIDRRQLLEKFHGDERLVEEWIQKEKEWKNELKKELTREKSVLEEHDLHIARKALQQVREGVEKYA